MEALRAKRLLLLRRDRVVGAASRDFFFFLHVYCNRMEIAPLGYRDRKDGENFCSRVSLFKSLSSFHLYLDFKNTDL